jgi:proteasome lid subunit RPN8/RPN11
MADIELGEVGELQIAEPPEKLIPTQDKARRVQAMGTIKEDDLHVFLREETLREIVIYSKSNLNYELGGVMVGDHYRWKDRHWIEIAGYIPAQHYVNTSASFRFTVESWAGITREKEKRYNDRPVLGWHHTHPRYGIFLSGTDMFTHSNFFNMPWHVAMVVDPVRDEMGFFQWKHKRVLPCGFFYIYDGVAAVRPGYKA